MAAVPAPTMSVIKGTTLPVKNTTDVAEFDIPQLVAVPVGVSTTISSGSDVPVRAAFSGGCLCIGASSLAAISSSHERLSATVALRICPMSGCSRVRVFSTFTGAVWHSLEASLRGSSSTALFVHILTRLCQE